MKILIVCQFYYPENFVITNIAEQLSLFGHDVTVLTGKPNYGYGHILKEYKHIKFEEINGVHVKRVHLLPRKKSKLSIICNYLSFYFSSKRWVRRTKDNFDVVYSFSLSPVTILGAGNLYKKKHHVRHIVHCVDLWPESVAVTKAVRRNSLMFKILYKWSKKLYSDADEILIGSPSFKEYFDKVLKLSDIKLTYIPQCALITKCALEPIIFDKNFVHIVYCGNIGRLQNLEIIPDAMKFVDSKVKFHIIGMGPLKNKLIELIKNNHLEDRVIYYGPKGIKEASRYFVNADAFYVSLSSSEFVGKTIPNKIAISLAFGKPIIAAIKGDGETILKDAKGSIICDENAANIAKNINNFIKISDKEKTVLGENNYKYYKENFAQEIIAKRIEQELLSK